MAQYTEYHPLKFWLDPASIAEIVAHIQTYLVNNPINSTTEIETIIHDYLIAHPELIGGVDSVNGQTGEVVLTADNIIAGESVTIKDVLDSLQNQIKDIVNDLNSIIVRDFALTNVVNLEGVTKINGVSFATSTAYPGYVIGSEHANFDSYYFYGNDGDKIFFDSTAPSAPAYIAVTYGVNPSKQWIDLTGNPYSMLCDSSARLRKSDNNLPTEANKLDISNCIVCITVTANTTVSFYINNKKSLSDDVIIPLEQGTGQNTDKAMSQKAVTDAINNSLSEGIINVSVSTNKYDFVINGYETSLVKTVSASTRANLWNFNGLRKNGETIFSSGTDIIGVLREVGEVDFMGGVHGDETNVEMLIYGDYVPLITSGSYKQVDIYMYSHLTRVSSGDNIIDRVVHITICNNSIMIDNTFICLVDGFQLTYAYNGGMFAWYKANAEKVYTSYGVFDPETDIIDWGMSKELLKTNIILSDGSQFEVENLIGRNYDKYLGEIHTYTNETNPRQKIYYATDNNSTWNSGHRCYGRCVYRLLK